MAVGTKDFLNLSVLQHSEMSLSLQLLLCPARMLWRGCLLFSKQNIISSSSVAPPQYWEGPAFCQLQKWHFFFFYQFVQAPTVFVCSATPPADNSIEQCTLNDSVIKHAHHVTAEIEGPETALAPPVHCFYVGRPLQFIIQHHPQVFAGLNSLPSINAD